MVVLLAVISTVITALSVRELLKRSPPQPLGTLLDSTVVPDWPGLLGFMLPRKLRRLWTGLMLVLSSAVCVAVHAVVVLYFDDDGPPKAIEVVFYCASLPMAVVGVYLPLSLWRGGRRAS